MSIGALVGVAAALELELDELPPKRCSGVDAFGMPATADGRCADQ